MNVPHRKDQKVFLAAMETAPPHGKTSMKHSISTLTPYNDKSVYQYPPIYASIINQ